MPKPSTTLNLELLGKIWALATGGTGGEATAAREHARRLVEKHGKTLADVPGLLREETAWAQPERNFTLHRTVWGQLSAAQQRAIRSLDAGRRRFRRRSGKTVYDAIGGDGDILAAASQSTLVAVAWGTSPIIAFDGPEGDRLASAYLTDWGIEVALRGDPEQPQRPAQPEPDGFGFYDTSNPDHMRKWAEADRVRKAARAAREIPAREEVLERYGSLETVLAWTERETALRAAVAPWAIFFSAPKQRWILSIDGYQEESLGDMPERVRAALASAYPLPTTITAAAAEYADWEARNRDLGLALEDTATNQLDLPAYLRKGIVCDLLETGLRATTLAEVLIRQRYAVASDMAQPDIEQAVLLDLEHLVALAAQVNVQDGQPAPASAAPAPSDWTSATDRRERVRALLSKVDTASLSDREIARRVGVSPQTVGNIRRRMAAEQQGEMFAA